MSVTILTGDCRKLLPTLSAESISCIVTSPPYWGLRNYGVADQIGLEASPQQYVDEIVKIGRELRRILRDDGTFWLNLGDCYTGSGKGGPGRSPHIKQGTNHGSLSVRGRKQRTGLEAKQLVGIPWRVAFALQADGWYLRQDIIWAKPNPMPESVRDRCTRSHEYLFMLSKSPRYFYDADAIKEDGVMRPQNRFTDRENHPKGDEGRPMHRRPPGGTGQLVDKQAGHGRRYVGFNDRWAAKEDAGSLTPKRNKRSVWFIAPKPFKGAHFATFPPALVEPCILAGCPVGGSVLDPFGGAGTVGVVAESIGRNATLIELNPSYVAMAQNRAANGNNLAQEAA